MSEFTAPSVEELQDKFPNHQIESFIAQGGMGAVYLATQTSLDRPVAIKILPKEFGEDEDYRVSFETEAKAMAKLNHSNLVGIYDFGDLDGMLYIIMEYIPGRSLFDTAHGQQVDQLEAASLIADMCVGLDHAHSAGMLHRDIKPANVLIDDEAKPKIVDFGLARPLGEEQSDGVVFGTPGYTAPEVLTNPFAVDQRSDIFSMGVMLYEMLTGQLPGNPVVPASNVSHSDARFDAILRKAIHPDPAQRYATAGEMADALDSLIKQFDQSPGLRAAGALVGNSAAMGAGAMAGGGINMAPKPVKLSSASGGNSGMVMGVVAALAIGGVAFVSMGGEDEAPKESAKELSHLEQLALEEDERAEKENQVRIRKEKAQKLREDRAERARLAAEQRMRLAAEKNLESKAPLNGTQEGEEGVLFLTEQGGDEGSIQDAIDKAMGGAGAGDTASEITTTEEAKYDYVGFLTEARTDVTASSASVLGDYKEIIDGEEEEVMDLLAELRMNPERKVRVEEWLVEFFEEWRENAIKPSIPERMPPRVEVRLGEFVAEMVEADAKRDEDLQRYNKAYADVIRKKGSELYKNEMMVSVEALKAELDALDKEGYFYAILCGKDPQPEDFEE
ncbi:MAG: protein kinase domain-containing protein [Akkermansiaceae bacterium]